METLILGSCKARPTANTFGEPGSHTPSTRLASIPQRPRVGSSPSATLQQWRSSVISFIISVICDRNRIICHQKRMTQSTLWLACSEPRDSVLACL